MKKDAIDTTHSPASQITAHTPASQIFSNSSDQFKSALCRRSRIQDIDDSGSLIVNYDTEQFPFEKIMVELLIERGFIDNPIRLEKLHKYLSSKDMEVNQNQINNVIKSLYDTNSAMDGLYKKLMTEIVVPVFAENSYIQKTPTNRFSFPFSPGMSNRDYHNDIMLGHPPEEINVWIPFTDSSLSKSFKVLPLKFSLEILKQFKYNFNDLHHAIWNDEDLINDFERVANCVEIKYGQVLLFDSRCIHASVLNHSDYTRVSMDVRLIPVIDYEKLPFKYIGTGIRKSEFTPQGYYYNNPIQFNN